MPRTLTSAAATEAAKSSGAQPIYILQIDWGGATGTKYYSDRELSSPVTAEARVMSWGNIQTEAKPDHVGGHGQVSVELLDTDHSLQNLFDTQPGVTAKRAFVKLYFGGTTWGTDDITLFAGVIAGQVEFDEPRATWRVNLKDLSAHFDKSIGVPCTRDKFPSIKCTDHEGEIIPIAYGDPVKRVPSRLIVQPSHATLVRAFGIHDTTLSLSQTANQMGVTPGVDVTLTVGTPGLWERVTGQFATGTTNVLTVTSRTAFLASGTSPGVYAYQGGQYLVISKADVPTPSLQRNGYPLWVKKDDQWVGAFVVDNWIDVGASIAVLREPVNIQFTTGMEWKLGASPGFIPHWPTGTSVYVGGEWVYACNHLPSEEVTAVEMAARAKAPDGSTGDLAFYRMSSSYYTVNLDNRTYNTELGRAAGDPGITTVTLSRPPIEYGAEDVLYVTLRATTDDETSSGNALSGPDEIISSLLTSEWLGNIDSSYVATLPSISTTMAFAITEESKLHDVCSNIAFQAGALYFWDEGKAQLVEMSNTLSGSTFTADRDAIADQSLRLSHADLEAAHTVAVGKFKPTMASPDVRYLRRSAGAIAQYGERRKEINFWALQDPDEVADRLSFWLGWYLSQQRTAKFRTFLNGVALRPGDVITVDYSDGAGNAILSSKLARVTRVSHRPPSASGGSMPEIEVEADYSVWSFSVDAFTEPAYLCEGNGGYLSIAPDDYRGIGVNIGIKSVSNFLQGSNANASISYGGGVGGTSSLLAIGILDGPMSAATHPITGATTVTMSVYEEGTGGNLQDSGDNITVTNRSVNAEADSGTMAIAASINGEWVLIWVDCEAP